MKSHKLLSFCTIALFISLSISSTTFACMLASGCEGESLNLYTSLNQGHEDIQEAELPPSAFTSASSTSG